MTVEEPNDVPIVRDRRRIDPETGQLRDATASAPDDEGTGAGKAGSRPAEGAPESATGAATADALAAAEALAAERLEQLQRVQAEYVNYRRRVERDRDLVRENAVASVLGEMLGILDDIGRAREHGDLTGGFRSVAEQIENVTAKLGLVKYGEPGDEFDPRIHEALMHEYSDEVSAPTCTQILMPGYRFGERVIRPARVAVAEPTEALPETKAEDKTAASDVAADTETDVEADTDETTATED